MDLVLGCRLGIVWRSLEPVIACLFLSSQQVSHFGARLHEPNSIQYSLLVTSIKTKTVDDLPIKNGGLPWFSICLHKGSLKLPEGKWKQVTMTALFSLPNNSQWTKFAVGSTHVRIPFCRLAQKKMTTVMSTLD